MNAARLPSCPVKENMVSYRYRPAVDTFFYTETEMTDPKPTGERQKEILEAARKLFLTKGYEAASTADIMNAVGIAKGTLYYHFSSKEEILDALLEDITDNIKRAALLFGEADDLPIPDRMIGVIRAVQAEGNGRGSIVSALHLPQNALFHQKSHILTIEKISPVMLKIVNDGIRRDFFHTDHPESAVHMALLYSLTAFDETGPDPEMVSGFIYNIERMLGAAEGSLSRLKELFGG